MRELVVKYLNKQISRRSFVGNLTKAGITVTAAQGVLASVSSVGLAQTGPAPAAARQPRRQRRPPPADRAPRWRASERCRAPAARPSPTSSSPPA